jgi:putative transposase
MVRHYSARGLKQSYCLSQVGLSKNQYYYQQTGKPRGRRPSTRTMKADPKTMETQQVDNTTVVQRIVEVKLEPDHANYYRLITKTLCLEGYYINHKKVYRLMHEHLLLEDRAKPSNKTYAKYRRVVPKGPLEIIEMDIKYVWVYEKRKYAFILSVIDTFTRYILHWDVGYSMKSEQVKSIWEYVIAHYIQPIRGKDAMVEIEVRTDNGKQFSSKEIVSFFEQNNLTQVFTHPYTPEENGHIESFHKTLGKAIKGDRYVSLEDVQKRLNRFYTTYNNLRSHGSIKGLPPAIFWALVDMEQIGIDINEEKRTSNLELKVAYQEILGLKGIHQHKYRVLRS